MRIDVVQFLTLLGVKNVRLNGEEVDYSCPFPGHSTGDTTSSASMHTRTTGFNCWGCGRHGNAVTFLSELEGIPPYRAKRYIKEHFERFQEPDGSFRDEIEQKIRASQASKPEPVLSEHEQEIRWVDWAKVEAAYSCGALTDGPFGYMLDRGFDGPTLSDWEIGFDVVSSHWISIPYRNVDGQLVGFKGRTWDVDADVRYRVLGGPGYGFEPVEVSRHVFGLHRAVALGLRDLVLIEGELNVIAWSQRGPGSPVGISGQFLSDRQVSLLKKHVDRLLLVFDDDTRAARAARQLEESISIRIAPPHLNDPAESDSVQLTELVAQSTPSIGYYVDTVE